MSSRLDRERRHLEELYGHYNRRAFVGSDPVGFLYPYPRLDDRETVGLIAATLAYGRVALIARSMAEVLRRLPGSPGRCAEVGLPALARSLEGFRHRFTTGEEIARLAWGAHCLRQEHGSLADALLAGQDPADETLGSGLTGFVAALRRASGIGRGHLLPSPADGSACKRLNLFLRWMVRRDEVDPGGWRAVSPRLLVVPLDVHMHRIARGLGLTSRRAADWKTALEVTRAFRARRPEDPVRYDFALTRLGIRGDLRPEEALAPLWCGAR